MCRFNVLVLALAICALDTLPAPAQPLFTHARTVEYVANNAWLVMLARVAEVEAIEGEAGSCVAIFAVDEVLKGGHETRRRLKVSEPVRVVRQWKDEARRVLVTTQDGNAAFATIDLGSELLAEMTADLTLLTTPEEVIRCYRETIRRSPGVTSTLSAGLRVPPEIAKRVEKWKEYHGVQATVPVDEALERTARKYVLSEDYLQRCEGARALQHFRSEENIARMKELLRDPGTSIVWHAEQNEGVEVRVYGVRTAAYETLKYWGIEVEKPVLREELRREREHIPKKKPETISGEAGGPDAALGRAASPRDDSSKPERTEKVEPAGKVYRGAASIRDGNHYADAVHVDVSDEDYPSKVVDMFRIMPKVETIVVAGPRYTDRHLQWLAAPAALRTLVLDSTDITDGAIERLRRTRPEVTVYRSQRWAIERLGGLATEMAGESRKIAEFDSPEVRRLRALVGPKHFVEATSIDFGRLPDDENGPGDEIQNEELLPIKYLTTATKVDLSYSRLNDAGMHYLKGLTKVTELTLPLDEVTAEGMAPLRGMTEVESFRGRLTDDKMATIAGFKKLKHLASGGEGLSDAGLRHLAELKDLKLLWLSGTDIRGPGLAHLDDKPGLESLTIKESTLADLSALPALPGLKSLHLEKTRVDDASLAHLAKCEALETVWLEDTPITDAGVAHLKKLKRLREVNLDGTKITDAALVELKQLPELRYLYLSGTQITTAGLKALREFPRLKKLYMYRVPVDDEGRRILSELEGIEIIPSPAAVASTEKTPQPADDAAANKAPRVPREIIERVEAECGWAGFSHRRKQRGLCVLEHFQTIYDDDLAALRELSDVTDISLGGGFSEDGIAHLRGLAHIEFVHLHFAVEITDDVLETLGTLPNLRELHLYTYNDPPRITQRGIDALAKLTKLERLSLQGVPITDADVRHVAAMPELRVLRLSCRKLTKASIEKLQGLKKLRVLALDGSPIGDEGLEIIGRMKNLERLSAARTNVRGDGLRHLTGLSKLTWLCLAGNQIESEDLSHLAALEKLERLDLEGNPIDDSGIDALGEIGLLEYVALGRTRVTEDGLARFETVSSAKAVKSLGGSVDRD